jgi:amino acid permease
MPITFQEKLLIMVWGLLIIGTIKHIHSVVDISIICVGTMYLVVGWIGFLMFGDTTKLIILDNYKATNLTLLARLAYSLLAAFSVPFQLHPCRTALESLLCSLKYISPLFNGYAPIATSTASTVGDVPNEKIRRWLLSGVILLLTYIFSFLIQNLDSILALVGATGGVIM